MRMGGEAEAASQERAQPQISVGEAVWIGGKAEGIRGRLIVERIPRVHGQAKIGIAEAGEQRSRIGGIHAGVDLSRIQERSLSIDVAGITVASAAKQNGTGKLLRRILGPGRGLDVVIDF